MFSFLYALEILRFALDDKMGKIRKSPFYGTSTNIHTNERSDVLASKEAFSGLRVGALRKIEYFPLRTKSCLSVASSFRLGKYDDFLAPERQPAVFLFVIFFFLMAERKSKSPAKPQNRKKFVEYQLVMQMKIFPLHNFSFKGERKITSALLNEASSQTSYHAPP